jgi:hypothetical protein
MTLKTCVLTGIALALFGCGGTVSGISGNGDGGGGHGHDGGGDANPPDTGMTTPDGSTGDTGTTTPEAGTDSALNHGSPSTTYPAFTPFMAQVLDNGGIVIQNPQIFTVSWPSLDTQTATWEALDDAIGPSSYWASTTAEYGIDPAIAGSPHIELTTAPSFSNMTDIENFVTANAASAWPPSTLSSDVLYVIYLPPGQSIDIEGIGDACSSGVEGYHDQTLSSDGTSTIIFGVVFQCSGERTGDITVSATHEMVEATTDPINNNTYYGFNDAQYLAWDIFQQQQDELADMCEFYFDDAFTDATLGQAVQRIWSNKSAASGSWPCVPGDGGPYYNVTPLMQETVNIDLSGFGGPAAYPGLGYTIPIGGTKTIPIGFYSDSAAPPWNIVVHGGNPLVGTTANVTATIDVPTGQNGDISYITVKVNAQDSSGTNSNLITVESQVAGDQTFELGPGVTIGVHSRWMPILISSEM